MIADLFLFGQQIFAVFLELPHGFHHDIHGIRFHVPMFYIYSADGPSYDEYGFMTSPSPTRHKNGSIFVDFKKQQGHDELLSTEMLKKFGLHRVGQRTVKLAGRAGNCFEYATETGFVNIHCVFGTELGIRFFGSSNEVDDLYAFMNKAESLPRKN
jgi:hypothetical protein